MQSQNPAAIPTIYASTTISPNDEYIQKRSSRIGQFKTAIEEYNQLLTTQKRDNAYFLSVLDSVIDSINDRTLDLAISLVKQMTTFGKLASALQQPSAAVDAWLSNMALVNMMLQKMDALLTVTQSKQATVRSVDLLNALNREMMIVTTTLTAAINVMKKPDDLSNIQNLLEQIEKMRYALEGHSLFRSIRSHTYAETAYKVLSKLGLYSAIALGLAIVTFIAFVGIPLAPLVALTGISLLLTIPTSMIAVIANIGATCVKPVNNILSGHSKICAGKLHNLAKEINKAHYATATAPWYQKLHASKNSIFSRPKIYPEKPVTPLPKAIILGC